MKRRAIEADRRVNLCVLSNAEPFNFVAIEGEATIQTDDLEPANPSCLRKHCRHRLRAPADLAGWLQSEHRVILRITAQRCHGVLVRRSLMNPFKLTDKHIAITGASSGLGAHFAGVLAAQGARVSLGARRVAKLAEQVAGLSASAARRRRFR